jgi:hypothetical protein
MQFFKKAGDRDAIDKIAYVAQPRFVCHCYALVHREARMCVYVGRDRQARVRSADPVLDSSSSVGARRRDNTLASLLHEAFKLLELRFKTYDHDGAGQKLEDAQC